jgi:hypothetical protein
LIARVVPKTPIYTIMKVPKVYSTFYGSFQKSIEVFRSLRKLLEVYGSF